MIKVRRSIFLSWSAGKIHPAIWKSWYLHRTYVSFAVIGTGLLSVELPAERFAAFLHEGSQADGQLHTGYRSPWFDALPQINLEISGGEKLQSIRLDVRPYHIGDFFNPGFYNIDGKRSVD